jgi:hypothetical protein
MPRYQVFSPDHEGPGQVLLDFANAVDAEEILPYFEKHGLTNIDPKAWYPHQKFLDVLSDISENPSAMFNFVSIGMKQAENAIIPPEFANLPLLTLLQGTGEVFKLNNRGSNVGELRCEVVTDHHIKMIMRIPQPDDLWYGIFYGYVRRFIPKGKHFTVYYDHEVPRRDEGGEVTIIHITWD